MDTIKPKVVLIDDNEDLVEVLEESLSKEFDIIKFSDSEEAVEHLSLNFIYDLIVCDYQMPKMNGAEVLKSLRQSGIMIPIVFLTGNVDLILALEALKLGAMDILDKPCSPQALEDVIKRVLLIEESKISYYKFLKDNNKKDKMLGLMYVGNRVKNKKQAS